MVETCALFFSLLWLAYLAKFLTEAKPAFAAIAIVAGSLGVLVKSTTFPAFAVLGGIAFLKEIHAAWTARALAARARPILLAAAVMAVPFVAGEAWTVYSDKVKSGNELGAFLTSTRLAKWIFGTWDQRIGATLWKEVIWDRTLANSFGYMALPGIALIAASFIRFRYAYAAMAAVVAFLVPFLVFTNLHIRHDYYQTANAIFIVAAAGLGIASLMSAKRTAIAAALLAVVVAGQLTYFRSTYAGLLTADFGQDQTFKIANVARTATPPGTSLIVIGTDWSSVVPYYAQRKAFAVPNWLPLASWRRILAAPQSFLDGVPMGGVVYCPDNLWPNAEREALVASFIAGRAIRGEVGPCKVLAPAKS